MHRVRSWTARTAEAPSHTFMGPAISFLAWNPHYWAKPPEKAYGIRDENLVEQLPRSQFDTDQDIQVGMQFQAMSEAGPRVVTVVSVDLENVTIDANHPLAGVTLHFDVTVKEIREATDEELNHGHVHGPDDDHHH